jgi:hypothetical protein
MSLYKKIMSTAKKVLIGDSPNVARLSYSRTPKEQSRALDLSMFPKVDDYLYRSPKLLNILRKLHYQDVPELSIRSMKKVHKHLKENPGSKLLVDITASDRPRVTEQLKKWVKKYKIQAYNLGNPKYHKNLEDKVWMEKAMEGYGSGKTKPLNEKILKKILADKKEAKKYFIKSRYGYAGEGVQQTTKALRKGMMKGKGGKHEDYKQLIKDLREGKGYIYQDKVKPLTEWRAHTVHGKVTDITPRWGSSFQEVLSALNPINRAKVKKHIEKAVKQINKRHPDAKKSALAFDISIDKKTGRPVIHEWQEQSGFLDIAGAPSYSGVIRGMTGKDLIGRRIAKRALVGAGTVGAGAAAASALPGLDHKKNKR